jgi:hypothetical protein
MTGVVIVSSEADAQNREIDTLVLGASGRWDAQAAAMQARPRS